MKKLIMAMLIAVSMVPTISAQDNNRQRMTPQQRTKQRIQKLDEKLSLTDNQKSQIRDLYAAIRKVRYATFTRTSTNRNIPRKNVKRRWKS